MNQVIWIVDSHLKLSIYDYASGLLLKSYGALSAGLTSNERSVQGHGLYGDWLWMQDRTWLYFWHHSLLSAHVADSNSNSQGSGPWFKLSYKESGSESFAAAILSHDGQYFISTLQNSGKIAIHSMNQGALVSSFQSQSLGSIQYLGLSQDDQLLLAMNREGAFEAWYLYDTFFSTTTMNEQRVGRSLYSRRLVSEPNKALSAHIYLTQGQSKQARFLVACGSNVHMLRLWTGEHLATFTFPTRISHIRLNSLESELYCASESNLSLYSLAINTRPDGASFSTLPTCHRFLLVDESRTTAPNPNPNPNHIVGLELSLDGTCLLSLSSEGILYYWDIQSRTRLKSLSLNSPSTSMSPMLYMRVSCRPPFLLEMPWLSESLLPLPPPPQLGGKSGSGGAKASLLIRLTDGQSRSLVLDRLFSSCSLTHPSASSSASTLEISRVAALKRSNERLKASNLHLIQSALLDRY